MKKKWVVGIIAAMVWLTAACGGGNEPADQTAQGAGGTPESSATATPTPTPDPTPTPTPEETTRTIQYLDEAYIVPAKTEKLVLASFEAMEDAAVLGVKGVGAVTDGTKIPDYLAEAMAGAVEVGNRQQPNAEAILQLKPDAILGSSKFQAPVVEQLSKIATLFPVSHISTNWEANLLLLGELTGLQEKAEQVIKQYKDDVEAAKQTLGADLQDKKIVMIRIRTGNINLYPPSVYFNPSLYTDLGFAVPDQLKELKAQEIVSLEQFSAIDPDYLFVQFADSENADQPKALEDLQNNPIWQSMTAVKNGKVFVNAVDPFAQGGTSWSKIAFLNAALDKLAP